MTFPIRISITIACAVMLPAFGATLGIFSDQFDDGAGGGDGGGRLVSGSLAG